MNNIILEFTPQEFSILHSKLGFIEGAARAIEKFPEICDLPNAGRGIQRRADGIATLLTQAMRGDLK